MTTNRSDRFINAVERLRASDGYQRMIRETPAPPASPKTPKPVAHAAPKKSITSRVGNFLMDLVGTVILSYGLIRLLDGMFTHRPIPWDITTGAAVIVLPFLVFMMLIYVTLYTLKAVLFFGEIALWIAKRRTPQH